MTEEVRIDPHAAVEEYKPQVLDRDWGQEVFIAQTDRYLGKLLKMKAGTAGGLQFHVEKDETFYLFEGEAEIEYDDGTGTLHTVRMTPGMSFHAQPGAAHRTNALTDCIFIETSTPHYDDRVHCEDRYGRGNPTGGLPSTWTTDDGVTYRRTG